ncbi:MAG: spore germination protein [Clostridia bacterium]|nr:spore germination protein [Clostridia bacterium]
MENFELLKNALPKAFSDMEDFFSRTLCFGKDEFFIYYIRGHSAGDAINRFVIAPISQAYLRGEGENPIESIVTNSGFTAAKSFEEAKNALLSGNALLVFACMPKDAFGYICATRNETARPNIEPETENVVRGPHEGFNENAQQSEVLLRRRIKSERLKSEKMSLGTLTKTDVIIMYIDGIVNERALYILKKRLCAIRADALIDSGSVEMYISDGKHALYPTVGNSERPDKVAGKILEGRIAVIVDGSPVVLTVPYLFCEGFQVSEDYAKSSFFATFVRSLRFAAVLFALYLPALFTALVTHHMDFLPREMADYMASTREGMTVSLLWEVVTAFIIFEILREVGLRMPKAVGSAVGIVGSLILGESAVSAGIISPFVLIIVAFSAVCNFICAPYMNPNGLYRFAVLLVSGFTGIFGFFAFLTATLLAGCTKSSFGVPYFAPFAPISTDGLSDFLYMSPIWKQKKVPACVSGRSVNRTEER